jgi:hypothetical protein
MGGAYPQASLPRHPFVAGERRPGAGTVPSYFKATTSLAEWLRQLIGIT